jgi:hypothetical protein
MEILRGWYLDEPTILAAVPQIKVPPDSWLVELSESIALRFLAKFG